MSENEKTEFARIWRELLDYARGGDAGARAFVLGQVRDPREPFRELALIEGEALLDELERPTEEGKRRFPPDGRLEGTPCLCTPECPDPCDRDACPCRACRRNRCDDSYY